MSGDRQRVLDLGDTQEAKGESPANGRKHGDRYCSALSQGGRIQAEKHRTPLPKLKTEVQATVRWCRYGLWSSFCLRSREAFLGKFTPTDHGAIPEPKREGLDGFA